MNKKEWLRKWLLIWANWKQSIEKQLLMKNLNYDYKINLLSAYTSTTRYIQDIIIELRGMK